MLVAYYSENVKVPDFLRRRVTAWVKSVAERYGRVVTEITFLFCDDAKIQELNRTYLGHDYPTDVITFPASKEELLIADIVISLDTVAINAEEYGATFEQELLRTMIHGVLHLCGLDDHSDADCKRMRRAEDEALALLPDDKRELWRGAV